MADFLNAAESEKSQRRWFQFSLITLLAAVALMAIPCSYIASQVRVIRHRAAERKWLESQGCEFEDDEWPEQVLDGLATGGLPGPVERGVPWVRRILGDRAVVGIRIWQSDEQHERALKAFPEAQLSLDYRAYPRAGSESLPSWFLIR